MHGFSRHQGETFALSEFDHHLPREISVNSRLLSSNSSTTYSPVRTGTFATLFQIKIIQFMDKHVAHRSRVIIWGREWKRDNR